MSSYTVPTPAECVMAERNALREERRAIEERERALDRKLEHHIHCGPTFSINADGTLRIAASNGPVTLNPDSAAKLRDFLAWFYPPTPPTK